MKKREQGNKLKAKPSSKKNCLGFSDQLSPHSGKTKQNKTKQKQKKKHEKKLISKDCLRLRFGDI